MESCFIVFPNIRSIYLAPTLPTSFPVGFLPILSPLPAESHSPYCLQPFVPTLLCVPVSTCWSQRTECQLMLTEHLLGAVHCANTACAWPYLTCKTTLCVGTIIVLILQIRNLLKISQLSRG